VSRVSVGAAVFYFTWNSTAPARFKPVEASSTSETRQKFPRSSLLEARPAVSADLLNSGEPTHHSNGQGVAHVGEERV
jgi:hypothetical protein